MNKIIKIQNNLEVSPAYNADNIEAVFTGSVQQQVIYQTLDEYTLPYGTYLTLRNYDDILFDKATLQTEKVNPLDPNDKIQEVYTIIESNEVPDCETMYNFFNQYYGQQYSESSSCKGVVIISTSEEVYNEIVVSYEDIGNNDFRITDINLNGEYSSLNEAVNKLKAENPVVFNFGNLYSKVAKYWKTKSNNVKTSTFDANHDPSLVQLLSFDGGFGDYPDSGSGSGVGEICATELWRQLDSTSQSINYIMPDGQYYLCKDVDDTDSTQNDIEIQDYNYNIFDILFRYIYDYLYYVEDVPATSTTPAQKQMHVKNPATYTFLLKTYKMYVKDKNSTPTSSSTPESVTSYSTKVLSVDEIKELYSTEAQEYFNNTIVHDIASYKDKLILTNEEAKEILLSKGIISCGHYFLISSNVGIKSPSSQQYDYFDLGNFEFTYEFKNSSGKITKNEYKYNTNGKVVKVRQIYDPYTDEYYTISQNNAGTFSNGYTIDRKGVCIRSTSGKCDYYYYENNEEGLALAEQLKEDILYAMEEGPSIVSTEFLIDMSY